MKTPEIHSQYCVVTGLSSPSCRWSSTSDSGVALRPRNDRAASPGSACVAAKMITDAKNSVTTPRRSLRTTKPLIPLIGASGAGRARPPRVPQTK